jgi:TolB-like protein
MSSLSKIQPPNRRLGSWKEIAAFFECDERTLRRWEKERGLPIHRAPGGAGGKVFAYTLELSTWLETSRNSISAASQVNGANQAEPTGHGKRIAFIDGQGSIEEVDAAESSFESRVIEPHSNGSSNSLWKIAGIASAVVAVSILAITLWHRSPGPDSIAVLPFSNGGGDAATEYLSDGITESLIDNLTHVPQLKVKSRNSVFRYKGKDKDIDARIVGNELGVAVLVTGKVVPEGNNIEVTAELTDVRDNTEIWGQQYHGNSADIILLQQQIAGDIAEKLRSKLSPSEKQQVTRQGTQNPEAYELYLRGRYAWNKRTTGDLEAAISYFNQAIAKDPGYASAYAGLADAYYVRQPRYSGAPSDNDPKASAAARRALELDPTLARPHAILGGSAMEYDWNFVGGEAEYKRAFELDPNDPTSHEWYAEKMGMIGGREQEALAEIDRAHQLDPLSSVITSQVGDVHNMARRFDDAINVCQELASDDPTFSRAHHCLAVAYWGKRMYPQVIEEWKTFGRLSGDQHESDFAAALDGGFRSGGWSGALAEGIETRQEQRKNGYSSPFVLAGLYADMGDKDRAFQWLDTAYHERDWLLTALKTDFLLDPIRSDPRFAQVVHKIGLP